MFKKRTKEKSSILCQDWVPKEINKSICSSDEKKHKRAAKNSTSTLSYFMKVEDGSKFMSKQKRRKKKNKGNYKMGS